VVNELSLAYANRSAALFHLKKYGAAIRDIDRALQRGYPQKMLYKIHERKGKCLRALGHPGEAVACFHTALTLLQDAQLPDDRTLAWRKSIEKDIADATAALSNGNEATANGARGQGQVTSSARWNVPTVLGHPHDVYHSLSNARRRQVRRQARTSPGDQL
jgi:tetratricopeptide (TPR) repeat protein